MVVADLDVVRIPVHEAETNAPLIVDRDRVLAPPIILERMEAIAGRHLEVVQLGRKMDILEFANRSGSDIDWEALRGAGGEELCRPAIREGLNHGVM